MKKNNSSYYLYGAAAIVVIVLIGFVATKERAPSIYDGFAQCVSDSGARMWGAWWCPHCENQKELFGNSFENIAYTECSTPGSQAMSKECQDDGIEGYPTWEFKDGSRLSGERSLEELSEKTGCDLPSKE
jgi:hypothetical protein